MSQTNLGYSSIFDNIGPTGAMGPQGEPGMRPKEVQDMKDVLTFLLKSLGYDLTFDELCELTEDEKVALMRDNRLNKILP